MKNVLRKSALFIFALFILCMFMGCPSPIDDKPDVEDEPDSYEVSSIRFVDENGNPLDEDTDPVWTDLLPGIETKIKEKLNATLGTSSAYAITNGWGTIEIYGSYSKLTKIQLDGLTSFFNTELDGVIGEYTFDFSASYRDEKGIFIELTKTPLYNHYTINDITFVGENNETLAEADWATLWAELEAGITPLLNTAFGENTWQAPSATGTFTVPEANNEITYEVYKTLKESLASDLDKVIADYEYDFSVEYNFETKKLTVSFTRISLDSTITVKNIYFRNDNGETLDSSTIPSWNQFWTIAEEVITPILDEAFGANGWSESNYMTIWYGRNEIKYAKYATLIAKLSDNCDITLGGYLYDFTASYDEKNKRINVRYATSPIAEGSTSDYYIVEEIHFKSGTLDFSYGSTPDWDELWKLIGDDVSDAFNIAFGDTNWKKDSLNDGEIMSNSGFELLAPATYDVLLAFLDNLNLSLSGKIYDFSSVYNYKNGVITVTYKTTPLANDVASDYYLVDAVVFLDSPGQPFDTYSMNPSWSEVWTKVETATVSILNTAFTSRSRWDDEPEENGYLSVDSGHTILDRIEYDTLFSSLSALEVITIGSYEYRFIPEYDNFGGRINISYESSLVAGSDETKTFNALEIGTYDREIDVTAKLVSPDKENVKIYLDVEETMLDTDIEYLADNFEAYYNMLTTIYGTHSDVDKNEKVIILLYDINKDYEAGNSYVAGFFRPQDVETRNYSNPHSNEAEILYVESQVANDIQNIFATVIHEFQHLINLSMDDKTGKETDLWLNEALSESTNIVFFDGLQGADGASIPPMMPLSRLYTYTEFNADNGLHEEIQKGNYFYTWDSSPNTVLADYATSSLFMYWLYLNGGGADLLTDVAQGTNRGTYKAVLDATGFTAWEEVLQSWLLANEFYNIPVFGTPENPRVGYPGGLFAYWHPDTGELMTGEIQLSSKVYEGSSTEVSLYPGDAVLTKTVITNTDEKLAKMWFGPEDDKTYITLNKDTTIRYPNDISVTLQENKPIIKSMQGSASTLPNIDYKIIDRSQKTKGSN